MAGGQVVPARALGCLIEPGRVADVGSPVVGVVEHLLVDRGDRVRAGQPLLTLRAEVERANVAVTARRAAINADVRAAQANLELAVQKLRRAEDLVRENFISHQALELARGEHELATQKLRQVQSQREVWAQEQRLAEAQLGLRTVRSPFDGVVAERFTNPGERVEDKPLLRVAAIDPLRVELMVPTSLYGRLRPGGKVDIQPELPGTLPVVATVTHVDPVLDAASNSFRVRLSLPNPDQSLPAGLRCRAELPGAAPAASLQPLPVAQHLPAAR